jgi:hypothetical protein
MEVHTHATTFLTLKLFSVAALLPVLAPYSHSVSNFQVIDSLTLLILKVRRRCALSSPFSTWNTIFSLKSQDLCPHMRVGSWYLHPTQIVVIFLIRSLEVTGRDHALLP